MDKSEFKARFDAYNGSFGFFRNEEWELSINKWKEYYSLIMSDNGLPFNKWIRDAEDLPSDQYLPAFLEHYEKKFGSARPGQTAENYMVYKTYDLTKHEGKQFFNKYNENKEERYSSSDTEARQSYETNIKPLVKQICSCKSLDEIYQVASSELYSRFHGKQLLQKIIVLNSIMYLEDDSVDDAMKNAFLWMYRSEDIKKLASILNVSYNNNWPLIKNNHNVYQRALEYSEIDKNNKQDTIKLYSFLWVIRDEVNTTSIFEERKMNTYNLLYFGAPGTGKSYKARASLRGLIVGNENGISQSEKEHKYSERVTFRADSTYGGFVGSYKPVPTTDGVGITYKFVPGPFMRLYVEAWKNPNKNYVLLIEELNRAEAAAVFGDIFQLLDRYGDGFSEYDIATTEEMKKFISSENISADSLSMVKEKYSETHNNENIDIDSIVSGKIMILPPNFYIRATMNSADQGVFPIDTAFKRRWSTCYVQIDDGESKIPSSAIIKAGNKQISWNALRKSINNVLKKKVNEDKLMGPFFIKMSEMGSAESCTEAFKNKVLDYLANDAAKMLIKDIFNIEFSRVLLSDLLCNFELNGFDIFNQGISIEPFLIDVSVNEEKDEDEDDTVEEVEQRNDNDNDTENETQAVDVN